MAETNAALVDLEVLAQYVGSNPVLLRQISEKFLLSAQETIEEMRQAAVLGQFSQVASLAHRLKPSVRAVGAIGMIEQVLRLEQAARDECGGEIQKQLNALTPVLVQLEQEIAALA